MNSLLKAFAAVALLGLALPALAAVKKAPTTQPVSCHGHVSKLSQTELDALEVHVAVRPERADRSWR